MIFDLDGTLLDTVVDIGNSVNDILKQFNYEQRSIKFYRDNVGGGIIDLLKKALPNDHGRPIDVYFDPLDRFYRLNLNKSAKVFENTLNISIWSSLAPLNNFCRCSRLVSLCQNSK